MSEYPPVVDKLLTLGDVRGSHDWLDYRELGLGEEHISDLVRMATETDLNRADGESQEVWAPLHAWRALGQFRAEAAIEPLMVLFEQEEDDWISDELPRVYGMIGPAAIPALVDYLADSSHGMFPRGRVGDSLVEIARTHPDARVECVAAITRQLERFAENDPELNGFLVSSLLDLEAVEAAPTMERAFAAGCVVEGIPGDWEDAQIALGLKAKRETPRDVHSPLLAPPPIFGHESVPQQADDRQKSSVKRKQKRKMQRQSRKKNRKRKKKR